MSIITRKCVEAIFADLPEELREALDRRAAQEHHYDQYSDGRTVEVGPRPDAYPLAHHQWFVRVVAVRELIYRLETYDQTKEPKYDGNWQEFVVPDLIEVLHENTDRGRANFAAACQAVAQHYRLRPDYAN